MDLQFKKLVGTEFKLQVPNPLKDQLLNLSEELSTPPYILTCILEFTSELNSDVDYIVDILSTQPVIVSRILKVANSAFYGLSRTVSSVNQAILFLGMQAVRNLVVTDSIQNIYQKKGPHHQYYNKLWKHSLATAIFSRMLAVKQPFTFNPEDAYITGLLHDMGKLALLEHYSNRYIKTLQDNTSNGQYLLQREEQTFGFAHPLVGAAIADNWLFPEGIIETIASNHHQASQDSIKGLVSSANIFVTTLGHNTHKATQKEISFVEEMGWDKEADHLNETLNEQLSIFSTRKTKQTVI